MLSIGAGAHGLNMTRRERLEANGWKFGTVAEFLGLTSEEEAIVEFRVALTKKLARLRREKGLTQQQLARLIGSSQSRVAKMEAGAPGVSVDLILTALFKMGMPPEPILKALE
jgi:DNA-binding XRE family transcriptional regulator